MLRPCILREMWCWWRALTLSGRNMLRWVRWRHCCQAGWMAWRGERLQTILPAGSLLQPDGNRDQLCGFLNWNWITAQLQLVKTSASTAPVSALRTTAQSPVFPTLRITEQVANSTSLPELQGHLWVFWLEEEVGNSRYRPGSSSGTNVSCLSWDCRIVL